MTNKILLLSVFTAMFFIGRPLWAQAQQSGSGGGGGGHYVIEQRYVQRLNWIGDEYTLKYEVVIEQSEARGYSVYSREFTKLPSLQISLPPGKYRYRVIPYDYLEQPGEASEWVNIEIKPAPVVPVEVQPRDDGSYVLHSLDNEQLIPGVDEVVIKNPNETETWETSESEKMFNLYFSAAWAPIIPLYGRMSEIFGHEFNAAGAAVRFGVLYNKLEWFNPGLELSASFYKLSIVEGNDKIGIQTGIIGINIVAQKLLPMKMAVTLRAGSAIVFQIGEINTTEYTSLMGGLAAQINLEASFLWFAWKQLYLEAGFGYNHLLNRDNNSGCLRPWLGAGWQF